MRDELNPGNILIGGAREGHGVVMFVDLVKSTRLAIKYSADPTKMLLTLNILIPTLMDIAHSSTGQFEKNTGDGILVYFGFDQSTSDDEASMWAIHAGSLMLRATNEVINPLLKERALDPVQITIGADLGPFLVAKIGLKRLESPIVAVGEVANRAAKIQASCAPNQFRIGEYMRSVLPGNMAARFRPATPPDRWPFRLRRSAREIAFDRTMERQRATQERQRWMNAGFGIQALFTPNYENYVPETRPYRIYRFAFA